MNIWKRLIKKRLEGQPVPGKEDKFSPAELEQMMIMAPGRKAELTKHMEEEPAPKIKWNPDKPTGMSFEEIHKLIAEEKAKQNRVKKIQSLRSRK